MHDDYCLQCLMIYHISLTHVKRIVLCVNLQTLFISFPITPRSSAGSSGERPRTVLVTTMKASPKLQTHSWRTRCGMNISHTILLYVAITAVVFITLDGFIESSHFSISRNDLPVEDNDFDWTAGKAKKTSLETHYAMVRMSSEFTAP
jgi:hypothetical protein